MSWCILCILPLVDDELVHFVYPRNLNSVLKSQKDSAAVSCNAKNSDCEMLVEIFFFFFFFFFELCFNASGFPDQGLNPGPYQ